MFKIVKKSVNWNDQKLEIETGKIARQANASVTVKMGRSVVLCTITFSKELKENIDFFPLSVHYIEKYYAAGRFPGGFIKREGKPSDRETLISRLIDRSIRPLFPEDFLHEVNVVCTVLSYDDKAPTDVLAIIGTAAALKISEIAFDNLLAAVKVSLINGQIKFNPSSDELKKSDLALVVASTKDSVLMIESSAKEISDTELIKAIELSHQNIQPVLDLIKDFSKEAGKNPCEYSKLQTEKVFNSLKKEYQESTASAYKITEKNERKKFLENLYQNARNQHSSQEDFQSNVFDTAYKKLQKTVVRTKVLESSIRIDGRKLNEIRNINCEVDLLPCTHGSALFTRGETQSFSTVTLGSLQDSQLRDDITGVYNERFMLHYNFPPYSVGEVGMLRPPGRREIGHGKLAFKAIAPILPNDQEDFPYTIRVVSEITESNGSSSMATVCAATLSMMDAGVPIKTPVSGIAMGLILEQDRYVILSDITGDEDALGDMDFKVASTKNGITALQMDIKTNGITIQIMKEAIIQARNGCAEILQKMNQTIDKPNPHLKSFAPRMSCVKIKKDKIKDVIGPGGKNIKDICERTGAKIDIEESGSVSIFAPDKQSLDKAVKIIKEITAVPEIGKIYKAQIMNIVEFGAFAKFLGETEGLIHISEIADRNIDSVDKILSKGMIINVKCVGKDYKGKIKLSMRNIEQTDELTNQNSWQTLMETEVKKHHTGVKKYQQVKRKTTINNTQNKYKNHNESDNKKSTSFSAKNIIKKLFS